MKRPNKNSGRHKPGRKPDQQRKSSERDKHPFRKFIDKKEGGSGKKGTKPDRKFRDSGSERPPRRDWEDKDRERGSGDRPDGRKRSAGGSRDSKPERRPRLDWDEKNHERRSGGRPARKSHSDRDHHDSRSERKPHRDWEEKDHKKDKTERTDRNKPAYRAGDRKESKPWNNDRAESRRRGDDHHDHRSERKFSRDGKHRGDKRKFDSDTREPREKRVEHEDFVSGKSFNKRDRGNARPAKTKHKEKHDPEGLIRLNKYLSNAGVASRRDADNLIISGAVKVNGVVVSQLGTKIRPGDKVTYGDQAVKGERKVYLLLNKPKDYITTMEDERDRKTVMELVEGACRERIYPVGRLDRNTTGLLLFTNDGELAAKLTHPKHGIKKVYHVSLNKGLKPEHFKEITEGVELEDGSVKVDDLAFIGEGKKEIGVEIHSGRNRVVRRLFEHLGYDVIKLDRVVFAGLTKKDLPRGKHRFLTPKEVSFLHMIG